MSKIFCLYLYSLDRKDAAFLDTISYAGCEVHRFDPSGRGSREPASIKNHRAWLDWRNPHRHAGLGGNLQHRLLDIMDSLGHSMVLTPKCTHSMIILHGLQVTVHCPLSTSHPLSSAKSVVNHHLYVHKSLFTRASSQQ